LFAYSTISHVGFILLALSVNSIESIQAYIFYIITYTISNLNGFIILIAIGYSFYLYVYKDEKHTDGALALKDVNNSPVQLISQLKGYFYINPYLAISLAITLFSFVGVPPLIGFFAKQMVLSAALDSGYVFMALVAILTSVIGAVYYLNIIKQIFFFKSDYIINPSLDNVELQGSISTKPIVTSDSEKLSFNTDNIVLSSGLSSSISILTLLLLLFIYIPNE
jgi:NADH-ubiquinone oxidoreductase chain 2